MKLISRKLQLHTSDWLFEATKVTEKTFNITCRVKVSKVTKKIIFNIIYRVKGSTTADIRKGDAQQGKSYLFRSLFVAFCYL